MVSTARTKKGVRRQIVISAGDEVKRGADGCIYIAQFNGEHGLIFALLRENLAASQQLAV
jgi:hypothetical protein